MSRSRVETAQGIGAQVLCLDDYSPPSATQNAKNDGMV